METIEGFPFLPVEFTKDGAVARPEQRKALMDELRNGYTDLFVISHGWNNDMKEARTLYNTFFKHFKAQMGAVEGLDTRRFVIAGVFWPSKKFAEKDLIPGNAAPSAGAAASAASTAGRADLKRELEELRKDFFDAPGAKEQRGFFDADDADERLQKAIGLVDRLNDSPAAQRAFVELLRGAVHREGDEAPEEQSVEKTFDEDGEKLLNRLGMPAGKRPAGAGGGAAGGVGGAGKPAADAQGSAAGVGSLVRGPIAGARQLLNLITYYQMKERAGRVGSQGLAPVLRAIRDAHGDLRLHLVGHSFGGRLLTAAAAGIKNQGPLPIATLTLLQAAFSHFGFAEKYDEKNDGFFRGVLADKKVQGPVLVTHTHNDKAVTVAYALASRIANQQASFIGDRNDRFGGIGANGALKCAAEDAALQAPGKAYAFQGGKVYNLKADPFISGHSDIANDATAFAVASAVAKT
jgi:hypothetical protein